MTHDNVSVTGGQVEEQWQYQLRVYLTDAAADAARGIASEASLGPLHRILEKHEATLVSQFDAFAAYVAEAEANGPENFPLYHWTKAVIDDPGKRAKHVGTFAVRIAGREVYPKAAADALEADLRPLAGGGTVMRLSRHDTNPANNLPVPEQYRTAGR